MIPSPKDTEPQAITARPGFFASAPAAVVITDPKLVKAGFRKWQFRILFWSTAGYAAFYLVRKNLPIAMPAMEAELHITKSQLGLFLSMHGVLYGISKFANGFLGDRCNARSLMVVGLVAS